MNKEEVLDEIFGNDPFDLLKVKPKSAVRNADDRLSSSFQEINEFVAKNGREPEPNVGNVSEFQLYSRLKSLRGDEEKVSQLKAEDEHGLLPTVDEQDDQQPKEINSVDDIFDDDLIDILGGDDEGLFDFKHTPKDFERAEADFVARRKACKDFEKYEGAFKQVQIDLSNGKRRLVPFTETLLKEGNYYVNNGILLYLESVDFETKGWSRGEKEKNRIRQFKDGRTKTIFENGTQSSMLLRSLGKALIMNGKAVTQNLEETNKGFIEKFGAISEDDKESGFIYVLKSLSTDDSIQGVEDLYKIGYSKGDVRKRIENAEKEPTYLMAPVEIVGAWQCYNMKPQKLEQLLHNFFGKSCLDLDVFDANGKRHRPQEWFIAPFEIIEQAIGLIISGEVVKHQYDNDSGSIVRTNK